MQRYSTFTVPQVDVNTKVNQCLLGLESSISSCRRHVDSVMEQVTTLVINLVDFSTFSDQAFNLIVLSSDQGVLKREEPLLVHLLDISSLVQKSVGKCHVWVFVVNKEGCSTWLVCQIEPYFPFDELLHGLEEGIIRRELSDTNHEWVSSHEVSVINCDLQITS